MPDQKPTLEYETQAPQWRRMSIWGLIVNGVVLPLFAAMIGFVAFMSAGRGDFGLWVFSGLLILGAAVTSVGVFVAYFGHR